MRAGTGLLVIAWLALGCTASGPRCMRPEDCAAGQMCSNGACVGLGTDAGNASADTGRDIGTPEDAAACSNGSTTCSGDQLRTCVAGTWSQATCPNGCDPSSTAHCTP